MGTIADGLIEKGLSRPKPGEIWLVTDGVILLDEEDRTNKHQRPCLVLTNPDVTRGHNAVQVVPLSRSGKRTKSSLPCSDLEDCSEDWEPSSRSKAILPFYQPIRVDAFEKWVAKVKDRTYRTIKDSLCLNVIGHVCKQWDLEP